MIRMMKKATSNNGKNKINNNNGKSQTICLVFVSYDTKIPNVEKKSDSLFHFAFDYIK